MPVTWHSTPYTIGPSIEIRDGAMYCPADSDRQVEVTEEMMESWGYERRDEMTVKQFLVTVKLPKRPGHRSTDPRPRVIGPCPLNPDKVCMDSTGEQHTVLWSGVNLEYAMKYWAEIEGYHVTRIEEA